jgi:hypothetical protein
LDTRDQRIEALQNKIKILHETVWERRADWPSVLTWLSQFTGRKSNDGNDEQLQALFLLSHFMYFGTEEVRALLRSLYRDLIRASVAASVREKNGRTLDRSILNAKINESLGNIRFLSLGNPSESSALILYYFRQENRLPKNMFLSPLEVFDYSKSPIALANSTIEEYIFIDDMCGSGTQGEAYSKGVVAAIKAIKPDVRMHYYALFGLADGLSHIRGLKAFDTVKAVVELDDSFKVFGPQSRVFDGSAVQHDGVLAKRILKNYGSQLWPNHPLGYKDGQLLLGFNYNTPDNTLPVFWADEEWGVQWRPIFKRYPKTEW